MKMLPIAALFSAALLAPAYGQQSLNCLVDHKFDAVTSDSYSQEQLEQLQFSVRVNLINETLSRCSFVQSEGRVTCDTYPLDRMVVAAGYVDIVKYYFFRGQFDLQIFNGSSFVENNGRGSIASGNCYPM